MIMTARERKKFCIIRNFLDRLNVQQR